MNFIALKMNFIEEAPRGEDQRLARCDGQTLDPCPLPALSASAIASSGARQVASGRMSYTYMYAMHDVSYM